MSSLIAADNGFAVAASLFSVVVFALAAERTELGRKLTAPLLALAIGMLLSNIRLLPFQSATYGFVEQYLVPMAIPLLLLNADLKRIFRETGPTLIAFFGGAVGTLLGAVIGFAIIDVGPETHKIVGVLAATFIGGSVNFVAVSQALDMEGSTLMGSAVAAQGVAGILYLSVLIAAPSLPFLQRWFAGASNKEHTETAVGEKMFDEEGLRTSRVPGCIAFSLVICAISYALAPVFRLPNYGILFITAITVAVATLAPGFTRRFQGGDSIGMVLVCVFIAGIGAQSNVGLLAGTAPVLLGFIGIVLTMHAATILLVGRLFRLTLPEVLIGSNACALGAVTAAAHAGGKRWISLVTPGILSGILGYVIANFIGVGLSGLLAP